MLVEDLEEGYDVDRSFPVHVAQPDNRATGSVKLAVKANLGWQDTGQSFDKGQGVRLECKGRFTVNDSPRPWISEPQGISIEYHRGHPLGKVVAVFVALDGSSVSERMPVGNAAVVTAPFDGSLWLQINDSSASRSNNSGGVDVLIQPAL